MRNRSNTALVTEQRKWGTPIVLSWWDWWIDCKIHGVIL